MGTTPARPGRAKHTTRPLRRLLVGLWLLAGVVACAHDTGTAMTPEASLPASPAPAVIEILSTPAGAIVSLNGTSRGGTPLRLTVSPGVHTVRLSAEGFAPVTVDVAVDSSHKVVVDEALRDVAAPAVELAPLAERVDAEAGLKVSARADDNLRVARMTLRLGDEAVYEVAEPTLRHNVDTRALPPGRYEVVVQAWDEAGNCGEARGSTTIVAPQPTVGRTPTGATPTVTRTAVAARPTAVAPRVEAENASPVAVAWGEVAIATYAYEGALYTDEARGHPYPLLDRGAVGGPRERTFRVLRLRNEYLELTFLPELGGRLYQARYLPTGQDLFYNNGAIKPTHWGPEDQGWWLAVGGMEWCLPVNEHGYVTAEPWETTVSQGGGAATATMTLAERSRGLEARVEVTLRPGEAGFTVRSTLRNPNTEARAFQYWINAMLAPGAYSAQQSLRFYYPTSEVIVHSRGDGSLPDAQGTMAWPVHDGRDMSLYGNWRDWLGFFAPNLAAPYTAVYDDAVALGVVRAYPPDVVRGNKLFAFGLGFGDSRAYTDDGSQYVEMWSGLSPTFWDDVTLGPNGGVAWEETWYAIAGTGGPSVANAQATLSAERSESTLEVTVGAIGARSWVLRVLQGEREVTRRDCSVRPEAPFRASLPLDGVGAADPLTIRVEDARGGTIIAYDI